jgi:aminoglycoside phosphotransferase
MRHDGRPLSDPMTNLPFDVLSDLLPSVFPGTPVLEGVTPMHGGLEAAVARLTIRHDARQQQHVVVKQLTASTRHEASRYRFFANDDLTPALHGVAEHGEHTYLFLEDVHPSSSWPWSDSAKTRLVLEQLARVHRAGVNAANHEQMDYEAALCASAAETVTLAEQVLPELGLSRELPVLRRVASSLAEARRDVMGILGTTLVHGDVHSGNVMLRRVRGVERVVFLDWGRSRTGSPLEDVSSWLLSLRTWEPAAGRDHDSLFRAYLAAAGFADGLTNDVRAAYWIAGASNALAGALRYHLFGTRTTTGKNRDIALAQTHAALRVIRRAGERMRSGRNRAAAAFRPDPAPES